MSAAFIPLAEFIHRGDDAYYYFKVAADYPRLGFWSFDGVEPTNGVQPLWAWILTGAALIASWLGITEATILDRWFVGLAAAFQVGGSVVLYQLLARQVSVSTGIAAAGASLFSIALVWGRVWGVESALLAFMLVATAAYYHVSIGRRPAWRTAAVLGVLLGLTALSRLNAGLLIPCLLGYHLLRRSAGPLPVRIRFVLVAGLAATAVLLPYFITNQLATGHVLPISGVVKSLHVQEALTAGGVEHRFSRDFASFVFWRWYQTVQWFITSRLLDGLWPTGIRLAINDAASWLTAAAIVGGLLVVPLAFGRPGEWLRLLRTRFARLAPFSYFAVYAGLEAVVAVGLYPTQNYAISRWWLVSSEFLLIVLGATLAGAVLSHAADRLRPVLEPARLATAALVGLVALVIAHGAQSIAHYWDGEIQYYDWSLSWNDESYLASRWLNRNVPADALVGSWNAGVLGYYTERRVVNLDGLINNGRLLTYLEQDRLEDYIRDRGLRYLSDMESMFERELQGKLKLTEVYSHFSPFMNQHYRIYRVEP